MLREVLGSFEQAVVTLQLRNRRPITASALARERDVITNCAHTF